MNWNHRAFSFFFLLAISLLTGFGLPQLRTDTTASSLISRFDPDRDAWEQVRQEFGSEQRTRLYVRDDNLWTEAKLLALRELHRELVAIDFVERVDDLFTHRLLRGKGGELENGVILPSIPKEKGELARIRGQAVNDPLISGELLSRDGTWTALTLSLKEEMETSGPGERRYKVLADLVSAHRQKFQEIFAIGPHRIEAEFHAALVKDCLRLAPAFALLVSVTILLVLRCVASALVPLLSAGLTLLWTLGVMGWTGVPLTISGALLPPLVIAFAFISGVPMVFACRPRGARARSPQGPGSLMRLMGLPLCITVFGLAAGLSAYEATGIGFIKDFTLAATFAALANGVTLLLLFPLVHYCLDSRGNGEDELPLGQQDAWAKLVRFVIGSPAPIMAFALFLTAFSLYQGSRLQVSTEAIGYFRPTSLLRQQLKGVQENLAGSKSFRITLVASKENAFLEPGNIERITTIQKFLDKLGVFERSTSLADLLALANREFHGGSQKYALPPRKKELVAQYLLLFDRQELSAYVSHDLRQATIVVRHQLTNSELLNDYVKELKNVLANVAGVEMQASITGENLMVNRGAPLLHQAWTRSLLSFGVVVLLLVSLMFVSPFGGIATLLLALTPLAMTLGLLGASQVPLTIGTAMVFLVASGFLSNGTIHLFGRYSDLCRLTPDYSLAVCAAIREQARPLGATAIGLIAGFSLLTNSRFSFVAQMGVFAAAALAFSLLGLLLVAPVIMSRIRLVGLYEILQLSIEKGALEKSSLFRGMSSYQIKKAILISELHLFEPGVLLMEQGSIGRSMYLILEGEAEVVLRGGNDHHSRRLALLNPGQVFGEIGYVRENKRTADVRALTRVQALRFDYERMKNDLKFFPFIVAKLNFNVCRILGERLAGAVDALHNLDERR